MELMRDGKHGNIRDGMEIIRNGKLVHHKKNLLLYYTPNKYYIRL